MRIRFLTMVVWLVLLPMAGMAKRVNISRHDLMDKIKGGWAAQTIGCTYGGPTEFRYLGSVIPEEVPIEWDDDVIRRTFESWPGLYDDIYMDLTFLRVLRDEGLDAPATSLAHAYAHARYPLWHANQAGRFNILRGLQPPMSGHWRNNPHADDIDFQIEADFAGIISPGMPNAASGLSDRVGHIMNYGNGWYGGVYVGAMYALAYIYNDVETIVRQALLTIPRKSRFHRAMQDVISWHAQYPADWKQTWQLVQDKYTDEVGCPDGVKAPFDIDALLNSAYIVLGLLYGEGDFDRTLEITTRCGQDSDCNPASAGGILGCMLGYSHLPEKWMKSLRGVEDISFAHTDISLNRVYEYSMELARQTILRNGGTELADSFLIRRQKPKAVRFEESFPGMSVSEVRTGGPLGEFGEQVFCGTGFVVAGGVECPDAKYVAEVEAVVDGRSLGVMRCPADFHDRTCELAWNYGLKRAEHTLSLRWLNPRSDAQVHCGRFIVYDKRRRAK